MDSAADTDSSSDSTSSSESSDGTSDSDSDAAPIAPSTETRGETPPPRTIKPLPARAQGRTRPERESVTPTTKPEIVVLSDSNDADRSTSS